jgi:two-component system, LytTR family, response regulator
MMPLRVAVIDDEPLVRERIAALVRDTGGLDLVGEAADGLSALDLITRLEPDLVFIDVELPELDGFGVIAALDVGRAPAIVFITAYERYALKAFDVGAIDYLHKPVTAPRFASAVARARARMDVRSPAQWGDVVANAATAERLRGHRTRFVVRKGNTHYFVPVNQVDWIDGSDNYLQLHVSDRIHLWRGTMKQAEAELDAERFVRVHRSAIIAVDRIVGVHVEDGGHVFELSGGARVRSSRQYADRVKRLLR